MTDKFKQRVKVRSDEIDGDDTGDHWQVYYVLYETEDDDGATCFDLYNDDDKGNGSMICRGYNLGDMRSLTLRLGTHVEWEEPHEFRQSTIRPDHCHECGQISASTVHTYTAETMPIEVARTIARRGGQELDWRRLRVAGEVLVRSAHDEDAELALVAVSVAVRKQCREIQA